MYDAIQNVAKWNESEYVCRNKQQQVNCIFDVLDKVSLRIVVVLSHENLSAYDDFVIVVFEYYFVLSSYWEV